MEIRIDGLMFCDDCTIAAVNNDFTELDYHYSPKEAEQKQADIEAGLKRWGMHLVPNFGENDEGIHEFSTRTCDCCGEWKAGSRHRFAVLG